MNETKTITRDGRQVIINKQDDFVYANLYVNVGHGMTGGAITLSRWQGKTMKGAERWAERMFKT